MVMFGDALPLAIKVRVSWPNPDLDLSHNDAEFEVLWFIL